MEQKRKEIYSIIAIVVLCVVTYFLRAKNYYITEIFSEAKYAAAALSVSGISDIFIPKLNGQNFVDIAPLYYVITSLFGGLFSFSEFSLRLPSALAAIGTVFAVYVAFKNVTNRNFATISALVILTSVGFIMFSTLASPFMICFCFQLIAILCGIMPIFSDENQPVQKFFTIFWISLVLSFLTAGIYAIVLPLLVVLLANVAFGKGKTLFCKNNVIVSAILLFVLLIFWVLFSTQVTGYMNFASIFSLAKINLPIANFKDFCLLNLGNFAYAIIPWLFVFVLVAITSVYKFIKDYIKCKKDGTEYIINNERKILIVSVIGFAVSLLQYFVAGVTDVSRMLPMIAFAAIITAYFWYRNLVDNEHNKMMLAASTAFYFLCIAASFAIVIAYFCVSPMYKSMIYPFLMPVIAITLFVAIVGTIALLLKRKVLNFSVHILFSLLIFFGLTGFVYNYVNSLGATDLVKCAQKAKADGATLVTFDIKNKYVLTFYYQKSVGFNGRYSAEDLFKLYGDTRKYYMVVKINDLIYLDRYFVYEVVETGKKYCAITNIKYLPSDEVRANLGYGQDIVL